MDDLNGRDPSVHKRFGDKSLIAHKPLSGDAPITMMVQYDDLQISPNYQSGSCATALDVETIAICEHRIGHKPEVLVYLDIRKDEMGRLQTSIHHRPPKGVE